jgi:MATE family multidrug resistance protein
MSFAVVDTVLTGHASAVDLATLGLGLSVYSTVFVGLMGAVSALNPVIAQHFGADRHAAIGASYGQGLWMALLLSGGVSSCSHSPKRGCLGFMPRPRWCRSWRNTCAS